MSEEILKATDAVVARLFAELRNIRDAAIRWEQTGIPPDRELVLRIRSYTDHIEDHLPEYERCRKELRKLKGEENS